MLIVFEGLDGSGKSTQIDMMLANQAKLNFGGVVVASSELYSTELGYNLKDILLNSSPNQDVLVGKAELLLWAALKAQHIERVVAPYLALGNIVLCDRYVYSTLAYQGYGKEISRSLINQVNRLATSELEADLTIWLDTTPELSVQRVHDRVAKSRREVATPINLDNFWIKAELLFYEKVRAGYQEIYSGLVKNYPDKIVRIDGSLSMETIHKKILHNVRQKLEDN